MKALLMFLATAILFVGAGFTAQDGSFEGMVDERAGMTVVRGSVLTFRPTFFVIQALPDAYQSEREEPGFPLSFTSSKATQYRDDRDEPVGIDTIKAGASVTVQAVSDAGRSVAQVVVVHRLSKGRTARR